MAKEKPVVFNFEDKFRIVVYDARNFQLQEWREHDIKVKGKPIGKEMRWSEDNCFYGTIRGALWCILNKKLLKKSFNDIQSVIDVIEKLNKKIDEMESKQWK